MSGPGVVGGVGGRIDKVGGRKEDSVYEGILAAIVRGECSNAIVRGECSNYAIRFED